MSKAKADTEAIVDLIKQLSRFANTEGRLLQDLNCNYSSIESKWNDLQYKQFHNALNENNKSVKKAVSLAEEHIRELKTVLKQLQNYLDTDGAQQSGFSVISPMLIIVLNDYLNDLKLNSEVPETLANIKLDPTSLKIRLVEETDSLREQFRQSKERLIRDWEINNDVSWPVYDHDIIDKDGNLVKRRGWKYDAHHIHPLAMGGENIATNITPFRYDLHSDHMGIHAYGSPYGVLDGLLRDNTNG